MKHDFPSVKYHEKQILFEDGKFCNLPSEYKRDSTKKQLEDFYKKLLDYESTELVKGEDILGFNYFRIGLICYVGLICECSIRSKGNNLKKNTHQTNFN